jgi:hypothetical protein
MQHLLPKYHWLWEQVEDKVFSLEYVSMSLMRADVLTKPLETVVHSQVLSLLGLVSHSALYSGSVEVMPSCYLFWISSVLICCL